jgi:peptide/nickel transport system ATP-binding protein
MVCATCSIRIFGIEMPEPVPTPPARPAATLEIEGLTIEFQARGGLQRVVDRVGLRIEPGEIVGVIGESGSGKTLTALSVLGLLPRGARIRSGSIRLSGTSLLDLSEDEWRAIRGDHVAFIPQDALRALNPVFPVGMQVGEPLNIHRGTPWQIAKRKAIELLRSVHLRDAEQRAEEYPHQFSGGMQQRAMVAMGLALEPQLLIADEPTTALDVTVQAQVLKLLREIRDAHGASILFITHDLGVVADLCDRVYVMYAGLVVEEGSVESIFSRPSHPYTQALLRATPTIRAVESELVSIPGQIPSPGNLPTGCRFADRCPVAFERCGEEPPPFDVGGGHLARCWRCAAPQ